jgi:hypothetical protein
MRKSVVVAAAVAFLGIINAARAVNFNSLGGSEMLFSGAGAVVGGTGSPLGNRFFLGILQRQLAAEAQQQAIANAAGLAEQRRLSPIINCQATASSTGISQLFACLSQVR